MTALLAVPPPLSAQADSLGALEFFGFRPGLPGTEVEARVAELGGTWRCGAAPSDPRLADCRGEFVSPESDRVLLTGALVHGRLAVLVLRGSLGEDGLAVWYRTLASRFGWVTARHDRGQDTWQWVRRGRMVRLNTRLDRGARMVSVTLVDGPLLDGLGPPPAL